MVWIWTLRLVLPALLLVLSVALKAIWSEAAYPPGVLDIIGTIMIAFAMMGILGWCANAWFGEGNQGDHAAPRREPSALEPLL